MLVINGGVSTHSLLAGSPAIDNGIAAGAPITDQVGNARVGNTDAGALENLTVVCTIIDQTVAAAVTSVCANSSTTVDLGSSETGVYYYLRDDANDTIVAGPIAGTGSGISLNTGNISSNITYNVYAEESAGALEFTGNGGLKKVSLGTALWDDNFVGTDQLTVEAWVKRSATGSLHTIIGNYVPGSWSFLLRIDSDKLALWMNNTAVATSNNAIPVGAWTHIAVTYDGVDAKIYINGIIETTTSFSGNFNAVPDELKIGGGLPSNTEYFPGDIADVRMWNVVKTDVEIAASMNSVLTGTEVGLIANYQFTEGTGTTTANAVTGNAYPGTLVNSPAWVSGPPLTGVGCLLEMAQTAAVTINQPTTGSQTLVECLGFSVTVGSSTYTTTGVYTDVLMNAAGCDSTVTTDLTVSAAIDVTVDNTSLPTLTANQTGATYQWLDCDNGNAPIASATNQSYTATVNGNYAVEVTVGSCTQTSGCENVSAVGIDVVSSKLTSIYPNPTQGIFTIDLAVVDENTSITVYDMLGKVVEKRLSVTTITSIDLSGNEKGIYFINIQSDKGQFVRKIILQ